MIGTRLAVVGAVLALVTASALGIWTAVASDYPAVEWPDIAAGVAMWSGPAIVSLVALRADRPTRAAIWIGSGITLALVAMASFTFWVPLLLGPPAVLLVLAGSREGAAGKRFGQALIVTIVIGVASIGAAYFLRERACWHRVVTADGSVWVKGPFSTRVTGDLDTPAIVCGPYATPLAVVLATGVWLVPAVLALRRGRIREEALA